MRRGKRKTPQKRYKVIYGPLDQLGDISPETRGALSRLHALVDAQAHRLRSILILGSGPIVIGQAAEAN